MEMDGLAALAGFAQVVDTIVPADAYPSASQAGVIGVLDRLSADDPSLRERVTTVVTRLVAAASVDEFGTGPLSAIDALAEDADVAWFIRLVQAVYYAGPGAGAGRAAWDMVGFRAAPPGGWKEFADVLGDRTGAIIGPGAIRDRYDAIVIGSGAGGGTAAMVLADAGYSVLVVERGSLPSSQSLWSDHLHSRRVDLTLDARSGPPSSGNPRLVERVDGATDTVWPWDARWGNNAMTVGGGTRVYGAQAWRLAPRDFRMASTYGVPDGSSLSDWPIAYEDLEPWYSLAEWELGVSGSSGGDPWQGKRSRGYPMDALPLNRSGAVLGEGARRLGIGTSRVGMLVNSIPYGGRPACKRCSACIGFDCPIGAKAGSHNTVLDRAIATGRCVLTAETRATRIATDSRGSVTGVVLAGRWDGRLWKKEVTAGVVVVAAGAVETARLLLASPSDREPNGLGNTTDQVGRHLQGHVYAGAIGVFPEEIQDDLGPGVSIATADYRHGNPGIVGGGILADEFVPIPIAAYNQLSRAGLIPAYGAGSKDGMRTLRKRMQRVIGPVHEVTSASSRVRLDPVLRDEHGVPVARLSGSLHREDLKTQRFLTERAIEWLDASGADRIVDCGEVRDADYGPSSGTHQAGTARMGTDPATSVTDPLGRVWGHGNLRIVDGALNVTNGGVNPVLTIYANAFRIASDLAANGGDRS